MLEEHWRPVRASAHKARAKLEIYSVRLVMLAENDVQRWYERHTGRSAIDAAVLCYIFVPWLSSARAELCMCLSLESSLSATALALALAALRPKLPSEVTRNLIRVK